MKALEVPGAALLKLAEEHGLATLPSRTALDIIHRDIPKPNQVLHDCVDVGDVLGIFGKSKQRKSWFALQLAVCLATGHDFLGWKVPRPMSVALFQMEVADDHYHRRIQNVCATMCNGGAVFQTALKNLRVFSCRGKDVTAEQLSAEVVTLKPEAAIIDPIYPLIAEENSSDSMKAVTQVFSGIAEAGALAAYVHHDKKGKSGDVDLVDRGSGHGIMGRSYDAAFFLDPHADSEDHTVVSTICRNYKGTEPQSCTWEDYVFAVDDESEASVETSHSANNKRQRGAPLSSLVAKAENLLPPGNVWLNDATEQLKADLGVGEKQAIKILKQLRDPDFGCYVEERGPHGRINLIPVRRDGPEVLEVPTVGAVSAFDR